MFPLELVTLKFTQGWIDLIVHSSLLLALGGETTGLVSLSWFTHKVPMHMFLAMILEAALLKDGDRLLEKQNESFGATR